jgi:ribose 5-phosphate isomerase B
MPDPMKVALAWDHAGLQLGRVLCAHLAAKGYITENLGAADASSVDYPDYAARVARQVQSGAATLGVLVCGTGIGMSLAANRFVGVRAALCAGATAARFARAHNDANVLCIGERISGVEVALSMLDAFVNTAFEGGRHQRRLDKLAAL